jgi:hypothetical protein
MRKTVLLTALFVAAVALFQSQARNANGRIVLGTSNTPVQLNGKLETNAAVFPLDTTLGFTVDGGLTVVGATTHVATVSLKSATTCGAAAACGSIALSSASPSTATVTVPSGVSCACWPIGTTAAIAAGGCAANVSATTLTLTGPNTVTTTMRYMCFL